MLCAHQCELIAVQLSGPVGFRAIAIHQSLLTVDLVLRLPGGEALREGGTQDGKVSIMVEHISKTYSLRVT